MIAFSYIEMLINGLRSRTDTRPDWLRAMPSASDDTALYYRFFHHLVEHVAPIRVLEIGTYFGTSACHFAFANVGGFVRTIDCNPDAKVALEQAAADRITNIWPVTSDSLAWAVQEPAKAYDVLFIDGLHNAAQVQAEYEAYRPFVRDDGLIFFDDIDLGDMPEFWRGVDDPKVRLDALHYTGFGCARVAP